MPILCVPVGYSPLQGSPVPCDFSRQEDWRGGPFHLPRDCPDPGVKPGLPASQVVSLPFEPPEKPIWMNRTEFQESCKLERVQRRAESGLQEQVWSTGSLNKSTKQRGLMRSFMSDLGSVWTQRREKGFIFLGPFPAIRSHFSLLDSISQSLLEKEPGLCGGKSPGFLERLGLESCF